MGGKSKNRAEHSPALTMALGGHPLGASVRPSYRFVGSESYSSAGEGGWEALGSL